MFKTIAAGALAGTIALTGLVAPTPVKAADSEDIARLLFGALVIYGLSEAADNRSDRQVVTPRPQPKPPKHRDDRISKRKVLPAHCVLTHRLPSGKVRAVMGNRCLKRNFGRYDRLPANCYRQFNTVKGTRVGWGRQCLRDAGYSW